jgi:hypothetical protein
MKKDVLIIFFVLILAGTMLFACARDEEESEPGAIEKLTDETADEIVKTIKTPINKAHSAKKSSEDRMKNIDDAVNE